jgi:uncharacterized surface protein with fasciclin (FAS1) repeats
MSNLEVVENGKMVIVKPRSVFEVVEGNRNLAIFTKGIKAAGLDTVLAQVGPFTIFAPTDYAFSKLEAGRMGRLLKEEDKGVLKTLLNHHVVEGITKFSELKDGLKLVTVNGKHLSVRIVDGKVTINGATVQNRDTEASNGIVHSLDTVIENEITL